MKRIKYILFTFLILFLYSSLALAECTNEELEELKQEANKIKVTYKHLGAVEVNGVNEYNHFKITINNINEDFDIYMIAYDIEIEKNGSTAEYELGTGKWTINVLSNKCGEIVRDIDFSLPTFNEFSLDPLCEGIDGEDFELCGKYYNSNYKISYDTFKRKVEEYRRTHEIKNEENNDTKESLSIKIILNKVLDFITNYQLYLIIFLGTLLMVLIIIIVIKKKRKRGVLE